MSAGRAIAHETRVRWPRVFVFAVVVCACSSSPVVTGSPWTYMQLKGNPQLDKVDLLFAIDNSASMGDKQALLAAAVPTLVGRLLNPRCVDADASKTCGAAID